jgi:hypothetical protein
MTLWLLSCSSRAMWGNAAIFRVIVPWVLRRQPCMPTLLILDGAHNATVSIKRSYELPVKQSLDIAFQTAASAGGTLPLGEMATRMTAIRYSRKA